jgi:hypothetical protein
LKTTVDVASTISTVSESDVAAPDEPSPSMLESFSSAFTPTRPEITATEVKVTPKLPTPPTYTTPPPPKAEVSERYVSKTYKDGKAITTSPLKGPSRCWISVYNSIRIEVLFKRKGGDIPIYRIGIVEDFHPTGFRFCRNKKL